MDVTACLRRVFHLVAPIVLLTGGVACAPVYYSAEQSDETELVADNEVLPQEGLDSSIDPAETVAAADQDQSLELVQVDSSSRLLGLSLETLGPGANMLVADLTQTDIATLERTAPSEYVLRLPNTTFDASVIETVVANPGSGAIRSVRPVSENGGSLLRIFAQPGVKLESKMGEKKILISSGRALDSDQVYAQVAPEKDPSPLITATGTATPTGVASVSDTTTAASTDGAIGELGEDTDLASLLEDDKRYVGRLISLDLQDTDIDNALRIIAEVSNLNIIASDDVTGKVTLRLIDVPWDQALDVILKTNGLDKVQEGNVIRIAPVEKLRQEREALKQATQAQEELEPLQVRYMRVSYAKASELRALVEAVVTERGTVAYDERTNQLIIKDINKGVKNAATLVGKLDLRTPQVLLETQIVEASRSLVRDLGSRFGFNFIQSPATGNATGSNFPNTIGVGGSTNSPTAIDASNPIVSILLDSADGTKNITAALSAYEQEGRARVISRPAISTTNNKQATIKSIQRLRVKTPSGGVSVATGQGASAAGTAAVATEQIEIGIVLEVTPQASPDYFVLLDVNAKSSTLGGDGPDGIPIEIERSSNSTVLVSSGQTFAMGGIYKITDNDAVNGVPFFKDIPFIGHMFRDAHITNSDEELIFFLTPRIIEGSFDDAAMKSSI